MRITITTGGSRGDVQPYTALGLGLQSSGHEVSIACSRAFEQLIIGRGLHFHAVSGDVRRLVQEILSAGSGSIRYVRRMSKILGETLEQSMNDYLIACRDADVVMYGPMGFLGRSAALDLKIPSVAAYLQPLFERTKSYRSSFAPRPPSFVSRSALGGAYNYATYIAAEQLFWQSFRGTINRIHRKELNIPGLPFSGPFSHFRSGQDLMLQGWSQAVLPAAPNLGEYVHTTGYWFLDAAHSWEPPPDLVDFLAAGPAPVSVGFGSAISSEPENLTNMVVEALEKVEQRATVLKVKELGHEDTSK